MFTYIRRKPARLLAKHIHTRDTGRETRARHKAVASLAKYSSIWKDYKPANSYAQNRVRGF